MERWDPPPAGSGATSAQNVTFRYRENGGAQKTCTVSGMEFVRRFLQHVLPKGFPTRAPLRLARSRRQDPVGAHSGLAGLEVSGSDPARSRTRTPLPGLWQVHVPARYAAARADRKAVASESISNRKSARVSRWRSGVARTRKNTGIRPPGTRFHSPILAGLRAGFPPSKPRPNFG